METTLDDKFEKVLFMIQETGRDLDKIKEVLDKKFQETDRMFGYQRNVGQLFYHIET